jgi:hypothetical protein
MQSDLKRMALNREYFKYNRTFLYCLASNKYVTNRKHEGAVWQLQIKHIN